MTDPNTDLQIDLPIETNGELKDALDTVIQSAFANGVDVNERGYNLRHDDPECLDWEVRIMHLK